MGLAENIKKARTNMHLTQKELAAKLKKYNIIIESTTISNWENKISKPDPDTMVALCEILNVDANYLLDINSSTKLSSKNGEISSKIEQLNDEQKDIIIKMIDNMK